MPHRAWRGRMTLLIKETVGDIDVSIIRDGGISFPREVFPDVSSETIDELLEQAGADSILTNFNCLLISKGDKHTLVDAGCRDVMGPDAGKLPDGLAEAGVTADEIGKLVITHLHPDHISGAITAEGEAVFANAEMILDTKEHAYWTDDGNFSGADDDGIAWRSVALQVLDAYDDRLKLISGETDITNGVASVPLPGHTPGHIGVIVESLGDSLFYVTDLYHAEDLQLIDTNICAAFDLDPDQARLIRFGTLEMLAGLQMPMSAGHMLSPAFGVLERSSRGYTLNRI